ncbi:hypothetical protein SATMO3_36650 [Sporomusa aerivorans]
MRLTGNMILITGGASGIDLSLTKRFLETGHLRQKTGQVDETSLVN